MANIKNDNEIYDKDYYGKFDIIQVVLCTKIRNGFGSP